MLSLLNFLILNTTKNIFLESITRANFLAVVVMEMLPNRQDRRGLREFELRQLRDSEVGRGSNNNSKKDGGKKEGRHFLNHDQGIVVYDLTFQKEVWLREALDLIFAKWRKVIEIIFEEQIRNEHIFWELIFQKSCSLVNRQLSLLTVLVFNLMEIIENLNLQIKGILDTDKLTEFTKR